MSTASTAPTRRDILATSAAVAATGALASAVGAIGFHTSSGNTLKVGLVGCGGRGTGAAKNALLADPDVKLVALGDVFADQVDTSHKALQGDAEIAAKVDVAPERKFSGFDCFRGVIDASDVVLLATAPYFRPMHLEAAVLAGKHCFVEKPIATDAPGVRSVLASCASAKKKNLSIVSGLCYRYEEKKRATLERVRGGAIGEITAAQCTYNTGELWHKGRQPEWSDMEWQIRNWLYFTWLSGDHNVEQHIHSLDKILWAMGDEPPQSATSSGGRTKRTDPKYGNVYDHFNTVYTWKSGVRLFSSCRQWNGASSDVSDHLFGTQGTAHLQSHEITGPQAWRWREREDQVDDMYQNEQDALFRAIRKNERIDDSDYMCKSTLLAILGRMAAYTGQTITWEQALNSQEQLGPAKLAFGPLDVAPIAVPGVTKFV